MSWGVSPWVYPVWDSLCLLDSLTISFSMLGILSTIISSKVFLDPFFSSFSGSPIIQMLTCLIYSQRSLETILSSFHSFYFILLFRSYFHHLSSSSLICSSASDILLLIPSRVFLISVIMLFFSVCLFFNSSQFSSVT